ncbi:MAG: hypothetical protein NWE80_02335 [Candidatus Bathyarchaeota archaeon]|nr:hypothetical protein [Candidatus Bathyarchaeota archaeon]
MLVSEQTNTEYVAYLKERNYDYYILGKKYVDSERALKPLSEKYWAKTLLVDTGKILGNLLLN